MKQIFDALFYQVKVHKDTKEGMANWDPDLYLYED